MCILYLRLTMFEEQELLDELQHNIQVMQIYMEVMYNHNEQLILDILWIKLRELYLWSLRHVVAFHVIILQIYLLEIYVNNEIFHKYMVYQDIHPRNRIFDKYNQL